MKKILLISSLALLNVFFAKSQTISFMEQKIIKGQPILETGINAKTDYSSEKGMKTIAWSKNKVVLEDYYQELNKLGYIMVEKSTTHILYKSCDKSILLKIEPSEYSTIFVITMDWFNSEKRKEVFYLNQCDAKAETPEEFTKHWNEMVEYDKKLEQANDQKNKGQTNVPFINNNEQHERVSVDSNVIFVLKGVTKLLSSEKSLEGVDLELKKNEKTITKTQTGANGKYFLMMEVSTSNVNNEYFLYISKPGTVPKKLCINAYLPKEEFKMDFPRYDFDLEIKMIETTIKDVVAQKPSGRIHWDKTQHAFAFDQTYSVISK